MKYLFPIYTLCRGGAQRMLAELTNGLALRGHDVTIVMPNAGEIEYPLDVEVRRTRKATFSLADLKPPVDVVVSNFYTLVDQVEAATSKSGALHVRLALCYEPCFLANPHESFRTYAVTRNLLVLSSWQRDLIELNHGVRGRVVPVGISQGFRNMGNRVAGDCVRVAAIVRMPEGGYANHRDQDYLLSELRKVMASHPHAEVTLISPPAEFERSPVLQNLKKERRLLIGRPRWRIRCPKDDVEICELLNEADIFVSSSYYDTAQLPSLEAMRCGAAVVTTYAGGNLDYAIHEHNCLLSYRVDRTLGEYVSRLVDDESLRRTLAANGARTAVDWTWDRSLTAFEAGVEYFLGRRAANAA